MTSGPGVTQADAGDRRRISAAALVVASLTSAAAAALGGTGWHVAAAVAYIALALAALSVPAALSAQVIAGQLLLVSVLAGQAATMMLAAVPMVATVIMTAELAALANRLNAPVAREPGQDVRAAARAGVIGGAVFALVALAGLLPGPTGVAAIVLASVACAGVAVLLVRNHAEQQ